MTIREAVRKGVEKYNFMRRHFPDWGPVMYDKFREILICGACEKHKRLPIEQYPCKDHEFIKAHENCKGKQNDAN